MPTKAFYAASIIASVKFNICCGNQYTSQLNSFNAAFARHSSIREVAAFAPRPSRKLFSPTAGVTSLGFFEPKLLHVMGKSASGSIYSPRISPPIATRRNTMLGMSFQPPQDKGTSLTPILFAAGFAALLFTPLGGIFFAVTNSLFLIALLTPVILILGFQIWTSMNLVQAPCPSCDAMAAAKKGSDSVPSPCLNCGCWVRTTKDGKGLEVCNAPNDNSNNFGDMGGFGDIFGTDFSSMNVDAQSPFESTFSESDEDI
eukprot:CAMPEP_0113321144 /NCGR_PEP_ID=MMETSP0010_2-20120614/14722_1 /TAXON_ID=216773 ORGANISM="Corethron hystrix, Strain 308" /NCGR_SAMPLE_ID=MMETSP0010_2 /ASSEMBLY_ACC=CAM_ASM_000155 /LENGTH=257 /DNA_ID=CAMNT_0000179171 /DNA_START=92 /DNA_END=862 /DNA_ORIENTATION=+ /assembly_acc=CAM_ASM_000155